MNKEANDENSSDKNQSHAVHYNSSRNRNEIRQHKSNVFSMLFRIPENALVLYNALNGTDYRDPGLVEILELSNGIQISIQDDVAFVLDSVLNIYEHQSTVNPNMAVRFLLYTGRRLRKILKGKKIHGERRVMFPEPRYAVFYNGSKDAPDRETQKLSDSFERATDNPQIELFVTVYNINPGHNTELKAKAGVLWEYTEFIERVRENRKMMDLETAINKAIDDCISDDILRDFLLEHRAEVIDSLPFDDTFERRIELEKQDVERYRKELEVTKEELSEANDKLSEAKMELSGKNAFIETLVSEIALLKKQLNDTGLAGSDE